MSAARAEETSLVPVTVDGQHVRLEMRVYKPASAGPTPTLVFTSSRSRDSARSWTA